MNRYRLSKYNPHFRNSKGEYLKKDWTSFNDIGKNFEGKVLTCNEYLKTENAYLNVIMSILHRLCVNNMCIVGLEKARSPQYFEKLEEMGIGITDEQCRSMSCLKNNSIINIRQLEGYFKLQLRERFWCRWIDASSDVIVDFGYDYYVYITCQKIDADLIKKAQDCGVYIEVEEGSTNRTGDGSVC